MEHIMVAGFKIEIESASDPFGGEYLIVKTGTTKLAGLQFDKKRPGLVEVRHRIGGIIKLKNDDIESKSLRGNSHL